MAPPPLASVQELADLINDEIVDDRDVKQALSFLRIASAQVRLHGAAWEDPILAPEIAITVTLDAASRGYLNPEGLNLERGDEITFGRDKHYSAGAALTDEEIALVRAAAHRSWLYSVPLVRDVSLDPSHFGVL